MGLNGGYPKKPSNFAVTAFVQNANSLPECQNLHSESSISLGKHAPGPLTLLCTKRLFPVLARVTLALILTN